MRVVLLVIGLVMCGIARGQSFAYAATKCDTATGTIEMRQVEAEYSSTAEDEEFKKAGVGAGWHITRIYDLIEYRKDEDDEDAPLHKAQKETRTLRCLLLGVPYRIVISPWYEAPFDFSPCGGYGPNAEISVWRNGALLVSEAHFAPECMPDGGYIGRPYVNRLTLREKGRFAQWEIRAEEVTLARRRASFRELARAAVSSTKLLDLQSPNPSLERP